MGYVSDSSPLSCRSFCFARCGSDSHGMGGRSNLSTSASDVSSGACTPRNHLRSEDLPITPLLTIKNTFIDGYADAAVADENLLRRAKSCPDLALLCQPRESAVAAEEHDIVVAREPQWSTGAALHSTGECRPCSWFWKPQGCQNGAECRHCHLCPQGIVKDRKKSKLNAKREQAVADMQDRKPEMSVGSARHYTGECKPCAWFWKPLGCRNGAECNYCHLCQEGQLKGNRKSNLAALRKQRFAEQTPSFPAVR